MAKIRTRARTVDMLGRQQIAGIPNAVSELFKNAHDAYARHAEIDFFEDDELLVIRDDGFGMSREDFEGKWLVLGTESKFVSGGTAQYVPPGADVRPVTGEKGIGRLAIGLLGRQVLVLTRAKRGQKIGDLVVSLIHWGLFELPGVNLDEIDVPLATFSGGTLPDSIQVSVLRQQLGNSVEKLREAHPELNFESILEDIAAFEPDPADLDLFFRDKDVGGLSLSGSGAGTHFLIAPANPIFRIDLAAEARLGDHSFTKHLMAFCNDVFLEDTKPPIKTAFRRWLPGALAGEELLDTDAFFSKEDISKADHLITGVVDSFGHFKGEVRIFDQVFPDEVIPWAENVGKATACGSFQVQFGYLMANAKDSHLSPEDYTELRGKLERFSGLYVYRDRIRVLPYGDSQVDWLEIELRRTKGAAHYFFSYRNLFGGVLISRAGNPGLQEKAGREGFQHNIAYRQLREILINLFQNLAAEFFRKGGSKSEYYEKKREEHARLAAALEKREKLVAARRRKLESSLSTFFERVASGLPESQVATLRRRTNERLELAAALKDQDKAANELIRVEKDAIEGIQTLRASYAIKKPVGVGLTKSLRRDWDGYLVEFARLDSEIFAPFSEEIAKTLSKVAKDARVYVDQRKRLEGRLSVLADEQKRKLQQTVDEARAVASDTRATVFDVTGKAISSLDETIKRIEIDLEGRDLEVLSPRDVEKLRHSWETELSRIETRHQDALTAARDMLASLSENLKTGNGDNPGEMIEAMEERMLALQEQSEDDFDMVQLGLAVAIINHEFSAAIRNVRRSIQELGQVSRRSQVLRPLYASIRENFQHLDGHLNLFTPLQRRLYRSAIKIDGKAIRNYVRELFSNRIERHHVDLQWTGAFLASEIECYPSTLYPVFINLVDNAISWLATSKGDRKILFDASGAGFLVANTGPEIAERDRESIFDRGFTRRSGGRGLGLFVSKRSVQREKMDLQLAPPPPGFNVAFRIAAPGIKVTL